MLGDGGLGDAQDLRGAGHLTLFRERHEDLERAQQVQIMRIFTRSQSCSRIDSGVATLQAFEAAVNGFFEPGHILHLRT